MRLTPRTILGQLIAGTVIVQLLVFIVFLAFSVHHQFAHNEQRDAERLRRQTDIIASLVAEPLVKNDPDLMDHVMHAVPIAASMKGARVTDTHGTMLRNTSNNLPLVLTAQERALLPKLAQNPAYQTLKTAGGELEGVQPVMADGLVRGIVWITEDTSITRTTPISVIENLLIYSPFALIGNLLLVWALSGSLARPLRRLREASHKVQMDPNDLSAFPLPTGENNEAGELTASVNAMVNEIATQRRGTQDTLSLLDSMLTGAPIGFGFYDSEYRYVRVNEQLAAMHGVPTEQHTGRRFRDIAPTRLGGTATRIESLIQRVFDTEKSVSDTEITCCLVSDDIESTFRTSYFPVFAGGEVRWVGVIASDITEHRYAEATSRSDEKVAAAGRLAISMANEISNPLETATRLLRELRERAALAPESRESLGQAEVELQRVGEITQQTLSYYRQPRTATEVLVTDVLRSVLTLYEAQLRARGIRLNLSLDDTAALYGHTADLRQLFANVVRSALNSDAGRLSIRVHQGSRCGVRGVRVTIAQDGTPLPETVKQSILELVVDEGSSNGVPWAKDEARTRGRVQVRSRSKLHGGASSGTVFRFFFPARGVPRGLFLVHSATPSRVLADQTV